MIERTTAILGIVINVCGFAILVWQLKQARESTALDHDRRRQQATLDFYSTTLDKMTELRFILPYDRDKVGVEELLSRAKGEDDEIGKSITEYLSLFELLATGVRMGVYDISVLERAAGGRIRAIASHYRPWIQRRRKAFKQPQLYEELELLARELEARRGLRFQRSAEDVNPLTVRTIESAARGSSP